MKVNGRPNCQLHGIYRLIVKNFQSAIHAHESCLFFFFAYLHPINIHTLLEVPKFNNFSFSWFRLSKFFLLFFCTRRGTSWTWIELQLWSMPPSWFLSRFCSHEWPATCFISVRIAVLYIRIERRILIFSHIEQASGQIAFNELIWACLLSDIEFDRM